MRSTVELLVYIPAIVLITFQLIPTHASTQDPCDPVNHRILSEEWRNVNNVLQAANESHCDNTIPIGWFRFMIGGENAVMPTTCVEVEHCGTLAPLWFSVTDDSPLLVGEERMGKACATWRRRDSTECCLFSKPMTVRNCGGFVIYKLRPPPGCDMAYCSKEIGSVVLNKVAHNIICKDGEIYNEGKLACEKLEQAQVDPDLVPVIGLPTLHPEATQGSVFMNCSAEVLSGESSDTRYQIYWFSKNKNRLISVLEVESSTASHLLEIGTTVQIGDTVVCAIEPKSLSGKTGTKSFSDEYFMGIQVPEGMLAEDQINVIRFITTVPVICDRLRKHCHMTLYIENKAGKTDAPVTLSECELKFRPAICNGSDCGHVELKIKPAQDYTNNYARMVTLGGMIQSLSLRMWNGYKIPEVKFRVRNVPMAECYSFTDPHMITFDKRKYDLYRRGTFVMYKDKQSTFEIHNRVWDCRNTVGYCNCGFIVRDRDDIISVDMCHERSLPGTAEVKVLSRTLSEKVKILEARDGGIVTLFLANGARIKTNIDYWGLSMTVRVPGSRVNNTLGLCGTFNENPDDDLHDDTGNVMHGNDPEVTAAEFAEIWRLSPGESLFEKLPDEDLFEEQLVHMAENQPLCRCVKNGRKPYAPYDDDCNDLESQTQLEILSYVDKTREYSPYNILANLGNRQKREAETDGTPNEIGSGDDTIENAYSKNGNTAKIRDAIVSSMLFPTGIETNEASKEGNVWLPAENEHSVRANEINSLSFRSSTDDYLLNTLLQFANSGYRFEPDFGSDTEDIVFPRWPTASGLTESDAYSLCSDVILDSAVASFCGSSLRERITDAIEICVKDIQIKDDTSLIPYAVTLAENMCELASIERSIAFSGGSTLITWPGGLRDMFNCPQSCNGQGTCTAEGCTCDPGFWGADCGQRTEEFLPADGAQNSFPLANLSSCDRRTDDCTFVVITVPLDAATNGRPKFQCKATPLRFSSENWMPSVSGIATSTRILPEGGVRCSLPPGEIRRARIIGVDKPPVQAFSVEVTDKLGRTINGTRILVFDSLCQDCPDGGLYGCEVKDNVCLINSLCYKAFELNSKNTCQQCVPEIDQFRWAQPKDNKPPIIHTPSDEVTMFVDDTLEHLLAATDPEGSPVSVWVQDDEAKIVPTGHFRWKPNPETLGPLPAVKNFKISASDNCNHTVSTVLEVLVLPCTCGKYGKCIRNDEDPLNSHFCQCVAGYTGVKCEKNVDDCTPNPCEQGRCEDRVAGYECVCDEGFEGPSCSESLDACLEKPCYDGVECSSVGNSFECGQCPEGMTGDGQICSDINDCTSQPCFPGATCQDIPAPDRGHTCGACPKYFVGNGERCVRTDRSACTEDVCFSKSICEELSNYPGYHCGPCPDGYSGDGRTCEALCDPPCRGNLQCIGPNVCGCREGYTGPSCTLPVCNPKCLNKGICYRPNECRCRPGYAGNQCQKAICNPPCQHGGQCVGRNLCACPYGFMGRKCEAMACRLPCQNGGVCTGANKCKCLPGYHGSQCQLPFCKPHCRNGGICIKPGVCQCPLSYFGKSCERATCRPSCLNGGKCKRSNTCQCSSGFSGSRCQIAICKSACMNGGRCISPDQCACQSGYKGENCEQAVCHLPCLNGGICFRPDICVCPRGYRGSNCARPICWPRCRYGGKCIGPNKCSCRNGFSGKFCERLTSRYG